MYFLNRPARPISNTFKTTWKECVAASHHLLPPSLNSWRYVYFLLMMMIINDLSAAKPKNPFGAPIAGLLDGLMLEREHPSCWLYYIAAVFWCIEITALCFLAVEREKTMKFMPIIVVAVYIDPRKSVRRWWWRLWRACQVIYQQPTMYYTAGSIAWRDCCRRIQNVFLFFFFSFFLFVCVRFIRVFSLSPSPSISQHFQGRRMQGGRGYVV